METTEQGTLVVAGQPFRLFIRSDFDLIYLAATGQRELALQVIADGVQHGVNAFRVFTRCWNLFPLSDRTEGYWDAADWVADTLERAGCYLLPVVILDRFRKDAQGQWVTLLDDAATDQWFEAWTDRYKGRAGIVWSIVNEPEQPWQGYDGPTDPRLLAFADRLAAKLGHRDFIIGAAPDGDDPDASQETIEASVILARYANLIALHSSRKGGYFPEPGGRWRRWIDHLEGLVDVIAACRKVNRRAHGVHEEPAGHASQESVPLPGGGVYHREWEHEAALAGALTAVFCGLTYCYHRIRHQDAGQPGLDLIGAILAQVPAGWEYLNDSWAGAPTRGFDGPHGEERPEGKVRHFVRPGGGAAWSLGYTTEGVPRVAWANGYSPAPPKGAEVYRGVRVAVWRSAQ